MTDTFVNIQESVPGFRPADAGSPAEAGAYGMYLFYCWQGLNGNDCSEARRELSGVHASIRALLREMDARRACYDPRELYAWLDWYVLLRRVAGGGPFDETELDALRERYVEGWLSGEAGYRAELAVAQILCWEERGSRLATPRRAGAPARLECCFPCWSGCSRGTSPRCRQGRWRHSTRSRCFWTRGGWRAGDERTTRAASCGSSPAGGT